VVCTEVWSLRESKSTSFETLAKFTFPTIDTNTVGHNTALHVVREVKLTIFNKKALCYPYFLTRVIVLINKFNIEIARKTSNCENNLTYNNYNIHCIIFKK